MWKEPRKPGRRRVLWLATVTLLTAARLLWGSPAVEAGEPEYPALLARAKADPANTDFMKLRLAFTLTNSYRPYGSSSGGERALSDAFKGQDWARAIQLTDAMLDENYVRIRTHVYAALAHDRLGNATRSEYHRAFARELVGSILRSGDGRTSATAFVVISTEEEYEVLRALRLQPIRQGLLREADRYVDRMRARSAESQEEIDLYFDVSIPFRHLGKELTK